MEAESALREALRLEPANERTCDILENVFIERADSGRDGNAAEAERLYREIIAMAPASGRAHNNLGVLLHGQGKLADARTPRGRVS